MTFAQQVQLFARKSQQATDKTVRAITFALFSEVIDRTPVGNPSLWKANKTAVEYNQAVSDSNSELRNDPANLTKGGRLRRGLKVNDSMDFSAGKDYVGGRLKGNWQASVNAPVAGTLTATDKDGGTTKTRMASAIGGWGSLTFLANNLPYAYRIEYDGWSKKQAPAGMVRVSFARVQQIVRREARKHKV